MQAIKLIIEGMYWDSQIYAGRLYLFDRHGSLLTLNWDRVVSEWLIPEPLRLALKCAFSRSDYLYGDQLSSIVHDTEVKSCLQSKFERLASESLFVDRQMIRENLISEQSSPFPFPHSDTKIYSKQFYASAPSGLYRTRCGKGLKAGVSSRSSKLWDCPVLALAVYGNTLALAAGDEGLHERRLGETAWTYAEEGGSQQSISIRSVTETHCEACEWAFWSIYGSSHVNGGFLAAFAVENETGSGANVGMTPDVLRETAEEQHHWRRAFSEIVDASKIFSSRGYSWANLDKIYQASNNHIKVIRFNPWARDEKPLFLELGLIELESERGEIVSGGVAVFGTVIECDECVVVILSDGTPIKIPGEPVRWRAFPRSKHYENQLHLIYRDRLEVWSFNQDYFVDQFGKLAGIKPRHNGFAPPLS
jgi:hypothetical protein